MRRIREIKIGDTVKWTSQAAGSVKEKCGIVIAQIAKNKNGLSALRSITRNFSNGQVKFQAFNMLTDRYIVTVPRGGKSALVDYYAPPVSWVSLIGGESHG